jgi:Tfp pilus assembly major pilin PilA
MLESVFTLWGMLIVAAICSMLATVAGSIAKNWRKAREAEYDAMLKIEMIKQGRSVEEIERVLNASGRDTAREGCKVGDTD